MWVEVVIFHPKWQRQLTLIPSSEHVVFENHFKSVSASDVTCFRIDKVAFFVNNMTVQIFEMELAQGVISVFNSTTPVTIEVAQDVVYVEISLIQLIRTILNPGLYIFTFLNLCCFPCFLISIKNITFIICKYKIPTDSAFLNALGNLIHTRHH